MEIPKVQTFTLSFGNAKIKITMITDDIIKSYEELMKNQETMIKIKKYPDISISKTLVKIGDICEIKLSPDNFEHIMEVFTLHYDSYTNAMSLENRRLVMIKYYNILDCREIELPETDDITEIENYINMLKMTLRMNEKILSAKFIFDQYDSRIKELYSGIDISYGPGMDKDKKKWSSDDYYSAITFLRRTYNIPNFKEEYYDEKTYDEYI
jgi:hypothetical protein